MKRITFFEVMIEFLVKQYVEDIREHVKKLEKVGEKIAKDIRATICIIKCPNWSLEKEVKHAA